MAENFKKILDQNQITQVKQQSPIIVDPKDSIQGVIARMQEKKRGCAIVCRENKMIGLFTERDLLRRVLAPQLDMREPIEKVMTPEPSFVDQSASIAWVMQIMSKKGYRHIPVVLANGEISGVVSVRDILNYLADHFPYEVYNLPPHPKQINTEADGA